MTTPSQGTGVARGASKPQDEEKLDARCDCGNMVAKTTDELVEIKCRRCKRFHQIPTQVEKNSVKQEQDETVAERCICGNLLAMISQETVEIKCRRCKRIHVITVKIEKKYWKRKIS